MIANYHTHTHRCNHAAGPDRAYVEQAIENGMQVLGFSDHAPMPFAGTYYSGFRMKPQETAEYVASLRCLREEYQKDIRILIGFETEYYPALFNDFLRLVEPYEPDYLILGQHALYNEENAPFSSAPTEDPGILRQYVDQVMQGLATGRFAYLAHPDMIRFEGNEDIYRQEITRLCTFCKEHAIPLEINLLGLMEQRHYPRPLFWEIASRVGNTAIIGCDAHKPEVLNNQELHAKGEAWAKRYGVPLLSRLAL